MTRIALTDGSGKWFDEDKAEVFNEDTDWDGNNRISCATGSQWNHETLYRTKSKRWVLNWWSQWQGSTETYTEIDDKTAAAWLVRNGHEHPDVEKEIVHLEL